MVNRKRGGDDVASCPTSPLELESVPPPDTNEKRRIAKALEYLHKDSRGKRVITTALLEFMTGIAAAKCRKVMEELVRDGYAEPADGGWKWTGKTFP